MSEFSDYIVYVDESGDHGLKNIDTDFPVFALAFCVISKKDYTEQIVPMIQNFKFRYFGHDAIILHEHEIRKEKNAFAVLRTDKKFRDAFMVDLSTIMAKSPISVFCSVIDKAKLKSQYATPFDPYGLALEFSMERIARFLMRNGQSNKLQHVVFECRGNKEDQELELVFRRICSRGTDPFGGIDFEPVFAKKAVNSAGLQLADLMARPIALSVMRPDQKNRTHEIIATKMEELKVFP